MTELGLRIPKEHDWTTAEKYATLAEERNVDAIWIPESWKLNQVPLMTLLRDRTRSIDVCSGIINVFSRSPSLVAMTAAGLHQVSHEGSFRLGLGASGPDVIENFHGYEFSKPISRLREYIELTQAFLSGGEVNHDGKIFDISGYEILDSSNGIDVPIYNAAMGQKNLELTGELADGWIPAFVPLAGLESSHEVITKGADKVGRNFNDISSAPFIITCISDEKKDETRDIVRSTLAFYVGAMGPFYYKTMKKHGFSDEANSIRKSWKNGEHSKARGEVTDELINEFSICGDHEEARLTLAKYLERGVDHPIARIPDNTPDDIIESTVKCWSTDLL